MKIFATALACSLSLAACDTTSSMSADGGPASAATPMPGAMSAIEGSVAYEVTFTPLWTAATHPVDYPKASLLSGPHFSGLIGASHAPGYAIFAEGSRPSPGLERLSEEGKHSPLDAEIRAAIAAGRAGELFETGPIKDLSTAATTTVRVSERFPRVSAVAMIAPSPDWFAGAADVDLFEGGRWASEKEVALLAFDSGGDRGASYTSGDADANPKEETRANEAAPFARSRTVGKLTFRRK